MKNLGLSEEWSSRFHCIGEWCGMWNPRVKRRQIVRTGLHLPRMNKSIVNSATMIFWSHIDCAHSGCSMHFDGKKLVSLVRSPLGFTISWFVGRRSFTKPNTTIGVKESGLKSPTTRWRLLRRGTIKEMRKERSKGCYIGITRKKNLSNQRNLKWQNVVIHQLP